MEPNKSLPYKLQGAIWKQPKAKYTPQRDDYMNTPKAFADPHKPGYGGGEWPFDKALALNNPKYRLGLRHAISSSWTDGYWKHEAKTLLLRVLDILIQIEVEREEALKGEATEVVNF